MIVVFSYLSLRGGIVMSVFVCLSVCLSVCLCVCVALSSLWRRSDTVCTSGFTDDVIFAHMPRLLDVAAQLKHSAHAASGFVINFAQ